LVLLASGFAAELRLGDRVVLEGPMGAGKSTFARALLYALGIEQPPEGSPTFAIAHEYTCRLGEVVHLDLYRLKSEIEIEQAGVPSYFWERDALVFVEWLSLWPDFEKSVTRSEEGSKAAIWSVQLSYASEGRRSVEITRLDGQRLKPRPTPLSHPPKSVEGKKPKALRKDSRSARRGSK